MATTGQVRTDADLNKFHVVEAVSINVGRVIRWGFGSLCIRYVYLSVLALSGKETVASFVLSLFGKATVQVSIYVALAVSGIAWGVVERYLRKRTTKTLGARIKYLESKVDPRRSSSNLTEDGSTRPEDEEL